jgi:FHA domain-containing protein
MSEDEKSKAPGDNPYLAAKMPSWWKPEYQKAASLAGSMTPEATPPAPVTPPPPPAPPPTTPAATATQPPAPAAAEPAPPSAPAPTPAATAAPPAPKPGPPTQAAPTMVLGVIPVAPPLAVLTVTAGPDTGFKFRVKPSAITAIGRGTDSDIVLDDPATSRKHAHIEFTDGKYVLKDQGSANGTLVNDQRVTERALADGDVIKIGQNSLKISIAAASPSSR